MSVYVEFEWTVSTAEFDSARGCRSPLEMLRYSGALSDVNVDDLGDGKSRIRVLLPLPNDRWAAEVLARFRSFGIAAKATARPPTKPKRSHIHRVLFPSVPGSTPPYRSTQAEPRNLPCADPRCPLAYMEPR